MRILPFLAVCALGMTAPCFATEPVLLDGPAIWSEEIGSPISDQARSCGLDPELLAITVQDYRVLPTTEADKARLEQKVAQISAVAGFNSAPASHQISRDFIRKILISRMILRLDYDGKDADKGMACLTDWLVGEGFQTITEGKAEAILKARNDW